MSNESFKFMMARKFLKNFFDKIRDLFYVFSFSKNAFNPMLWAKYANNNYGFILSYDGDKVIETIRNSYINNTVFEDFKDEIIFRDVSYTYMNQTIHSEQVLDLLSLINPNDFYSVVNSYNIKLYTYIMKKLYNSLFFVKTPEWKGEQETRLVLPANVIDRQIINNNHCSISSIQSNAIVVSMDSKIGYLCKAFGLARKNNVNCYSIDYIADNKELEINPISNDLILQYLKIAESGKLGNVL